jgi:glycosyltransferase involved in cell wall biosynthesis
MRGPLDGPGVRFLFENPHDARALRLDPADRTKVRLVGGAGIDPDALRPSPLPAGPPLKVALVARMLWSKGVDLAVEAVRRARVAGADVSLDIFGAPDPSNPKAFTQDRLEAWSREEGISWRGPTRDIAGVWAEHHVGCLPSRGGEGLPRTLLETAACGRAMLTTAVPGCGDFVRDGIEGLVVPPDDAPALAEALVRLAADPALVARMGEAARARVLDGYTEAQVGAAVVGLYRDMLADGR